MFLEDGLGQNGRAGVTAKGQLMIQGDVNTALYAATENGDAFVVCSEWVALTAATSGTNGAAILFIKPSAKMTHLNRLRLCSTQPCKWEILLAPTAGTIVTNAVEGHAENMNLSSNKHFDGTIFKGVDGDTFTDGHDAMCVVTPAYGSEELYFEDALMIPENESFGILVYPSADCDVSVTGIMYNHSGHGGH